MTSSANDEWDSYKLGSAVHLLRMDASRATRLNAHIAEMLNHAADFIEWNMRELEITGGNGD